MRKLPEDVALRKSTIMKNGKVKKEVIYEYDMMPRKTIPLVLEDDGSFPIIKASGSIASGTGTGTTSIASGGGSVGIGTIAPSTGLTLNPWVNTNDNLAELIELAKDIKGLKQLGSYHLGKVDTLKSVVEKLDGCKKVPDVYKVLDELKEELKMCLATKE